MQVAVIVVTAFNTGSALKMKLAEVVNGATAAQRCLLVVVCEMAPGAVTKEQLEVSNSRADKLDSSPSYVCGCAR
jgi:hypothetical protein